MSSQWWRFHNRRLNELNAQARRQSSQSKGQKTSTVFYVTGADLEWITSNPGAVYQELAEDGIWKSHWRIEFQPVNSFGKPQGAGAEMRVVEDTVLFRSPNQGKFNAVR